MKMVFVGRTNDTVKDSARSEDSEQSGDSLSPVVRKPYTRPDAKDYDGPCKYVRAIREWEYAKDAGRMRPLDPMLIDDDILPSNKGRVDR